CGCCVIQKKSDFDEFMKLAYAFQAKGMRRFSFALFTEGQLAPGPRAPRQEKPAGKDRPKPAKKPG
ncbi:MAG: hypothetical protein J5600_02430, partial [Desulfovibrio sp.]|nr:hypothetical protein [Desulfovibrio sp.]